MLSTATAWGSPLRMSCDWRSTSVAFASALDLEHARLARDHGEVGPQQQGPAHFRLAPRPVGDDEVGLVAEFRQFVEHFVGVVKLECADLRHGLADPFRGGTLGVAVGEDDGVALLEEPGGEVDGERRLPYPAFCISDGDDHDRDARPARGRLASNISRQPGQHVCRTHGRAAARPVDLPTTHPTDNTDQPHGGGAARASGRGAGSPPTHKPTHQQAIRQSRRPATRPAGRKSITQHNPPDRQHRSRPTDQATDRPARHAPTRPRDSATDCADDKTQSLQTCLSYCKQACMLASKSCDLPTGQAAVLNLLSSPKCTRMFV